MPKGQFRFLRNNLYSFRLEKLGDSLAVASYLYRSLDKQHGVFENSLLDESVRSAWEVFPLEAINRLVDQAVQTGGTPYDWIDHALFSSGIAKFRSYPMLTGIRAHLRERNPLFESDVIEVYQRTPYAWRFLGPLFRRAILRINPTVARIINNNVGMDPTAPASMQALSLDANILWRAGDLRMRTILRRVGLTSARPQLAGNYPEPADFTRLLGDTKTEATEAYRVLLSGPLAQSGMVNPNAIQQAITNCRHGNSESAETLLTLISIAKWLDMYPARLAG
jgi:hypothetical protein